MNTVKIKVPATTANIGPGFDCLGMALDLWNEIEFTPKTNSSSISITGEGIQELPRDSENMIIQAANKVFEHLKASPPDNYTIKCINGIPLCSGLGSSAAAVLAGMLLGNYLLGNPLSAQDLIELGTQIEGHPDNIAPAILGGLTINRLKTSNQIKISPSYPAPLKTYLSYSAHQAGRSRALILTKKAAWLQ